MCSALKVNRLLHSTCSEVRSNSRGGASVIFLWLTDFIVRGSVDMFCRACRACCLFVKPREFGLLFSSSSCTTAVKSVLR